MDDGSEFHILSCLCHRSSMGLPPAIDAFYLPSEKQLWSQSICKPILFVCRLSHPLVQSSHSFCVSRGSFLVVSMVRILFPLQPKNLIVSYFVLSSLVFR